MNKNNAEAKAFFEGVDSYATDKADFGVAVHPMELVNSSNTAKIYEK